jgi:hypothetical protein
MVTAHPDCTATLQAPPPSWCQALLPDHRRGAHRSTTSTTPCDPHLESPQTPPLQLSGFLGSWAHSPGRQGLAGHLLGKGRPSQALSLPKVPNLERRSKGSWRGLKDTLGGRSLQDVNSLLKKRALNEQGQALGVSIPESGALLHSGHGLLSPATRAEAGGVPGPATPLVHTHRQPASCIPKRPGLTRRQGAERVGHPGRIQLHLLTPVRHRLVASRW